MENDLITVTFSLLPDIDDFPYLKTFEVVNGEQVMDKILCEYLKVEYFSLFTNELLLLITTLQALRITGEVITMPCSFVATIHAL